MFESAELGHKVNKETFDREEPSLRDELLRAQADLLEKAEFSVCIVIGGMDGAGKGEMANLLNEWFDPRHVSTHALGAPEAGRPPLRSAWNALPPKGKTAVFVGSWYTIPFFQRVNRRLGRGAYDRLLHDARAFETLLANEGVLVLKFWLHLSKKAQRRAFKVLEENPLTRWRVTADDWANHAEYARVRRIAEETIRATSTADAPWHIVEAADREYRALTVGRGILDAMRRRLDSKEPRVSGARVPPRLPSIDQIDVLDALDHSKMLEKEAYEVRLEELQGRLNAVFRHEEMRKRSVIAMFEGADAAGKGGAIRRITAALDARQYRVVPIAAPTVEERSRPYLWRFWRHVPERGQITIFDRSWYGRVLVERVEKFCAEPDWMRAYGEINDFEDQLCRAGVILVKFWLQISEDEQLKRFEERAQTAYKRFKIGPEDWRNREKWGAYREAVNEMVERTSTATSPWKLVEANDKRHARIEVLGTLCERVERELGG
ncbi:MAG: polyphosphate:AMP phosphotransferase [Polyangiaceae bacterium]